MISKKIDMIDLIGKQYKRIMQCKKRYLAVKGSRASKKSKNIALRWILLLYEYDESNLLVVRKYAALLKQSCRADLIWAIKRIGVEADWKIPRGEMTLTRKSTGQVILFRGASEPESISSITVEQGILNFLWVEEAYQLDKQADFDMIDETIRGQVPEGYFKQTVLTFNPWHETSWLKQRFFMLNPEEMEDDESVAYIPGMQKSTLLTLAMTRNYTCNEWLDEADYANFERMRVEQPARYKVAGLGEWGVTGSKIYTNYEVKEFNWRTLFYQKNEEGTPIYEHRIGLDFGYSANTAGLRILVDRGKREIYIAEELYEQRLSTDEIYHKLRSLDWALEPIHADSEAPQTIKDLRKLGCPRIFGVKKVAGSVTSGIQDIRGYKIYIHPTCENFEIEISHYSFKQDAQGKELPQPEKQWDHLMDAMRYALIDDSAGIEFVNVEKIESRTAEGDRRRYQEQLKRALSIK